MAEATFQVIIPGWITRIGDKLVICTSGHAYPPGVLIIPNDKSYKRFIKNTWYD
jgi:hypothetical protein